MKRIVVDFDDTLSFTLNRNWDNAIPNEALIKKLNDLYYNGWEIIILTARGQLSCNGNVEEADNKYRDQIENWLNKNGVKYNRLSFNKILASYYIDDKGYKPADFIDINIHEITSGHSGDKIYREDQYIYKDDHNAHQTVKWYETVKRDLYIPTIYSLIGKTIKMEYIERTDDIGFYDIPDIIDRIKEIPNNNTNSFDTYINRIQSHLDYNHMDMKLVNILKEHRHRFSRARSFCHGDLSIDNMIKRDNKVYLIDPIYDNSFWSSWLLDISKLMHSARKFLKLDLYRDIKNYYSEYSIQLDILEATQWVRILKYEKNVELYNHYKKIVEDDIEALSLKKTR